MRSVGVDPFKTTADADRDGLPDALELSLGTNPKVADTDGDEMPDGDESAQLLGATDPTLTDTDKDGVDDGAEDTDGDSLSNVRELALGTDPVSPDVDNDSLDDAAEIDAGTKPRTADTDKDGLLDGFEVRAGLDPLAADSDGDGVPDADEVIDQPVVASGGVKVSVRATGDLASDVTVTPVDATTQERAFGAVGSTYDLQLPTDRSDDLLQARLTLPYPADLPAGTDPSELRILTYDEQQQRWTPTGTDLALDETTRTVSVTVTHFSRYAIFDIANWQQQWTSVGAGCTPGDDPLPADVALVIDSSGSMTTNDPQGLRRAAVVDFDDTARVLAALTSDKAALEAAIALIDDVGGTDVAAGVSAGLGTLPEPTDQRVNALILLTDGQGAWDDALIARARTLRTPLFTIGLGTGPDAALLQRIAAETEGQYFAVASADELPEVFRSIAGCVNDPTPSGVADPDCGNADTDNDGLADCLETGGMALGNGTAVRTDPANDDSDGDGIPDGQEMGVPSDVVTGIAAFSASSDPTAADTDGDGLRDTEELDQGTSSWVGDSDSDGLVDADEADHGTAPLERDTDGDGFADGYEVDNAADMGLRPTLPDVVLDKWDYVKYFVQGALCGDVTWSWIGCAENDQVVRLVGYIVGSFIPLIDIRDAVAGLIKGDTVGTLFSVAGLIPVIGDAAGVGGKVGKYISRFPAKRVDAIRWVANSGLLSDGVKAAVLRIILPGFRTLESAGFTPAAIGRIAGHQDIDMLVAALNSALRLTGPRAVAMPWAVAQGNLRASKVAEQQVQRLVMPVLEPDWVANASTTNFRRLVTQGGRRVFLREDDIVYGEGLDKAIEVKAGPATRFNRNSDLCEQARKDRGLVDSGVLSEKVWHFVPAQVFKRRGAEFWGGGPGHGGLGLPDPVRHRVRHPRARRMSAVREGHPDDAARLAQWLAFVPQAPAELKARLGVTVTGSPDDLVPLWTAAIPQLAYASPGGPAWEELPPWKQWPAVTRRPPGSGAVTGQTHYLIGAIAAYYGELLRAHYPRPLHWQVFRYRYERISDEGYLVIASREIHRKGMPMMWFNPLHNVNVMTGNQLRDPLTPGGRIVGKDDPRSLLDLFTMHLDQAG